MTAVLDDLLARYAEDWFQAVEVAYCARQRGARTLAEVRALSIETIAAGLHAGYFVGGDATPDGFEPWAGGPDEVIARLRDEWPLDHYVETGEVCWLDPTEAGEVKAAEVHRRYFP